MVYQVTFIDQLERAVLTIDIEAAEDDAAVELACAHCVGADMAVELSESDRHVMRITPMAARLYLTNQHERQHL